MNSSQAFEIAIGAARESRDPAKQDRLGELQNTIDELVGSFEGRGPRMVWPAPILAIWPHPDRFPTAKGGPRT